MVSLAVLAILILLVGPLLAIFALVKISNLEAAIRNLQVSLAAATNAPKAAMTVTRESLKREMTEAAAAAKPEQVAVPELESEPVPTPVLEPEPAQPLAPTQKRDVENALASRWFVWAGGIAVALGGLLFIKYAHDAGLIPPMARVIVGLVAAGALVYAGEWARKRDAALANGYIPAALSAAGIVVAFGILYAAYALYDILSPAFCFPLLVAVGLGALWLSRRQGPLIAALGLLGAFVAPMLVPSENPSSIGFFAYLAVVLCASLYELRDRPWWWLGFAAIGGVTVWSLMWINGFGLDPLWPIGIFAFLTGLAATFLPRGKAILASDKGSLAEPNAMHPAMTIAVVGIAAGAVQLAILVLRSEHAALALVFFAISMAAIVAFGWWRNGMVAAPLLAAPLLAALGTWIVLMAWPEVGFHEWAFDERGFWVTVPGLIEPPRFRDAMLAALVAFTAVGAWGTLQKIENRPWAALAAASAFAFLFGAWARADFTSPMVLWMAMAVALAALLYGLATRLRPSIESVVNARSIEILLGGVVLLLLFAADRWQDGVWLTLIVAIIATATALTTRQFPLVNIAAMAAAVATFAAARLFVGREFWGEPTGVPLGAHWVLYGYGIPAALFWWTSRQLASSPTHRHPPLDAEDPLDRAKLQQPVGGPPEVGHDGDGSAGGFKRYRMAFEGLALGLAISLVSLELRVLIGGGITKDGFGLLELSAHALAWAGAAYGLAYRQQIFSSFISLWGARVLLGAACLAFLAALTTRNPVVTGAALEGNAIINTLWLAYLAPVPLLALMARKLDGLGLAKFRNAFGVFALVLLITFVTLQVKRWFQDATLDIAFLSQAESYTTSLAWVVIGILIFVAGLKLNRQNIRYGGLAILVLAVIKVFAWDLFELGGLWRIASMIGLGLCLIGVGWLYTRFVQKPKVAV